MIFKVPPTLISYASKGQEPQTARRARTMTKPKNTPMVLVEESNLCSY